MANELNSTAHHEHLDADHEKESALRKIQTAGSISISPELFEKIYLSPQNVVKGDIRKTFANPTPVCLVGFLLSLTPLSCDLMGFQGITNTNAPGQGAQGAYWFFGAFLMILGSIGEFLLGNTFPMVVFASFGAFWGWFGAVNNTVAFDPSSLYAAKGQDPNYWQSNGFFLIFMGVLCFVYLILSVRTNLVFFAIFLCLVPAFACLSKAYFDVAQVYVEAAAGNKAASASDLNTAHNYILAGGALAFVVSMLGWWIFIAIMLAALDFPFQLPVGDLSHIVKGASERAQ